MTLGLERSPRRQVGGSNPLAPTIYQREPFGENVEGLSLCNAKTCVAHSDSQQVLAGNGGARPQDAQEPGQDVIASRETGAAVVAMVWRCPEKEQPEGEPNQEKERVPQPRVGNGCSPGVRPGGRVSPLRAFWDFLKHNKKWWSLPILPALAIVALLVMLSASGLAPLLDPLCERQPTGVRTPLRLGGG